MKLNHQNLLKRFIRTLACVIIVCIGGRVSADLPKDWQEWTPNEVLSSLSAETWASLAATDRELLTNHVWTLYLDDGGEEASLGLSEFTKLAERFQDRIDSSRHDILATALTDRIQSNRGELSSLGVWDVWRLRRLAKELDITSDTTSEWTKTYLLTNTSMLDRAGNTELGLLIGWVNDVEQTLDEDMSNTRQTLINHIDNLMAESDGNSATALYAKLRLITSNSSTDHAEKDQDIASQIMDLVGSNQDAFLGFTVWNIDYLRKESRKAGIDESLVTEWTLTWLLNSNVWMQNATYREFNALYDWIFLARTHPQAREAERRLIEHLRDRLAIDPSLLAVADSQGMGLARVLRSLAPRLDEDQLETLAHYVADRFEETDSIDGFHWHYENMASLFDTEQLREDLRTRLVDDQGNPRVKIGKLLTWRYRGTAQAALWRSELEDKAANESLPMNQRSRWMLMRADAASPVGLTVNDPTDTKTPREWAVDALSAASDEQDRLAVLKWIVADDMRFNRSDKAEAILAAEASKLSDSPTLSEVNDMQLQVSNNSADK